MNRDDSPMPHVLYEDASLLAVDKPSGLLTHRGWGRDAVVLTDMVGAYLGRRTVHLLHRLDRQTSGVVLFAKTRECAAILRDSFDAGDIKKTYLALVRGVPPSEGIIDHPIPRSEGGVRVPSVTAYRRLASRENEIRTLSLVRAEPRTGRLHQVRRHLKHISHPIIGDSNYGKGAINRAIRERFGLSRLGLHAAEISFSHPSSGERISVHAPIPSDLTIPLGRMGFEIVL